MAAEGFLASMQTNSPLRIVHYLSDLHWSMGGLMRFVVDAATVLAARGNEITLFTCDATHAPPEWMTGQAGKPRVVLLRRRFGLLNRSSIRQAEQILRQSDVLHLHGPWPPANYQLARLARRCGIPYAVTLHGMLDDWCMRQKPMKKRIYLTLVARRMLERASIVQCTADEEVRQAQRWMGRRARVVTLLPLIDVADASHILGTESAWRALPSMREGGANVLFVSRLHPKKGVELLLDAAAELVRRNFHFRMIIAGDGEAEYLRQLQSRAAELGLSERVFFLTPFNNKIRQSLYEASDVFVLPTHEENFGLVFAESMAMGTPVITTRGVDIWENLEQVGAIIVRRDAKEIADQIQKLVSDRELWQEKSVRGRMWVLRGLDPDVIAPQYEQLYSSLAAGAN